jgi:quercetin dioxygenase-like cupin family protein
MKLVTALLLPLSLVVPASAQMPVPIEKEPWHQLKFENRYVRLFDVSIPPGATTLPHIHVNDAVGVRLTDATLVDDAVGEKPSEVSVARGSVSFSYRPTPLTHKVTNTGTTPYRNLLLEVLPSTKSSPDTASLADVPGHTLVMENDRVRVVRLVLAPGESTKVHSHALRGIGIALTKGELSIEVPGKDLKTIQLSPGDYQWHEIGTTHSLTNVGATAIEVVDIELK